MDCRNKYEWAIIGATSGKHDLKVHAKKWSQGKWVVAIMLHNFLSSMLIGSDCLILRGVEMSILTSCLVVPSFGEKNWGGTKATHHFALANKVVICKMYI